MAASTRVQRKNQLTSERAGVARSTLARMNNIMESQLKALEQRIAALESLSMSSAGAIIAFSATLPYLMEAIVRSGQNMVAITTAVNDLFKLIIGLHPEIESDKKKDALTLIRRA